MNERQSWSLADTQVKNLGGRLDFSAFVGALEDSTPEEAVGFRDHSELVYDASYRRELWAAEYLARGGFSNDGFDDPPGLHSFHRREGPTAA